MEEGGGGKRSVEEGGVVAIHYRKIWFLVSFLKDTVLAVVTKALRQKKKQKPDFRCLPVNFQDFPSLR